jgi:hypothetical protein
VVEVVDTSIPKAKEVIQPLVKESGKGKKRDKKEAEEDEMFADSRGTGPSKYRFPLPFSPLSRYSWTGWNRFDADDVGRKTEEGFLIYKEAELDIDPEAGGTPLCPFDCECCRCSPAISLYQY